MVPLGHHETSSQPCKGQLHIGLHQ